jgi:general secretion pathway protein F
MVTAAEACGELTQALQSMGTRLDRRASGASRLLAIVAYPALVLCVGVGVVVFLGTRTLPELAAILQAAGIPLPRLTDAVISLSRWMSAWGWLAAAGAAIFALSWGPVSRSLPDSVRNVLRVRIRLARTIAVGAASRTLADLLGAGVPLVEAIRITAPSTPPSLAAALRTAADEVERGSDLSSAFDDPHWFNAETVRLLDLAQTAGDLGSALAQLADRNERRADRAMTLLATMLEPALILMLALLVGLVVMAAILPILRLQEAI